MAVEKGITISRNDHINMLIKDSDATMPQKLVKIHITRDLIPTNLAIIELRRTTNQDPLNLNNKTKTNYTSYYHINLKDNIVLSFREKDIANKYYKLLVNGLYNELVEPHKVHPELFL